MNFNRHLELQGRHAQFSPSQSSWLRYDDDKLLFTYANRNRKALGTEIHDFASSQIELSQKVSTARHLVNAVATFIFAKYKALNQLEYGMSLIRSLKDLPDDIFDTLKLFINDAIGYRMSSEVPLVYSNRFFGTTDAIAFRNNFLRVHDLKSGEGKADFEQLLIYVALACIEYKLKPADIQIECRIYQYGEAHCYEPSVDEIVPIIDAIIHKDKLLLPMINEEEI